MKFLRVVGWAKGHRNALVVAALISVLAGVDLLLNRPKDSGVQWFSVPLLVVGFGLLSLILWPTVKPGPRPPSDTLAHRLLWWASGRGRLTPFFPVIGAGIVVADLAYNAFLSAVPALLTHDLVALLLGATLIGYRSVPGRYARERDFVLLFTAVLFLILVVPVLFVRLLVQDPSASVDAYSAYLLAPQTSAVVNLFGVHSTVVFLPPETAPGIAFRTAGNLDVTVFITSSCSGIYSFAIFVSAFSAFVLTEMRRLTRRVVAFLALGVFFAYVANVLRMVVIILVGYAFDTPDTGLQTLLVAHSNAGWIIFLGWIALFWFLLFRFLPAEPPKSTEGAPSPVTPPRRGTFCGICGIVLTPAIPATRCACGKFYHLECLSAEGRCPSCAAPSPALAYPAIDHPAS